MQGTSLGIGNDWLRLLKLKENHPGQRLLLRVVNLILPCMFDKKNYDGCIVHKGPLIIQSALLASTGQNATRLPTQRNQKAHCPHEQEGIFGSKNTNSYECCWTSVSPLKMESQTTLATTPMFSRESYRRAQGVAAHCLHEVADLKAA